ncbi:MAG: FHA domain-containing protein [Anaerolineaceae bacterium]
MFLETIENKLQSLLEGTLDRLLYPGFSRSLSSRLVSIIDEKLNSQTGQDKTAPDLIDIYVSPEKWDAWQEAHDTLDQVANELEKSWSEQGYIFRTHPKIQVNIDPELAVDAVDIKTSYSQGELLASETALQIVARPHVSEAMPRNAYFIINGKEQVALEKPVINIGRRSSSDIILHDPLVSRDHVQLRAEQGRYILFDLSSTGGTHINNHSVKAATLKPGDVIRLGKTILIYNQDFSGVATETKAIVMEQDPEA